MTKMFGFGIATIAMLVFAEVASAALVSISFAPGRDPSAAELGGDGSLAGKKIYDFYLTSDADVLSVDEVVIDLQGSTLYQNAVGSDVEPPNPLFLGVFPALGADSWITTPGAATSSAGGGFSAPNSSWFDTSSDGAVNNFLFARLTTSGMGTFTGRVNLADGASVANFAFSLPVGIPEPASMALAGMAVVGLVAMRRRSVA